MPPYSSGRKTSWIPSSGPHISRIVLSGHSFRASRSRRKAGVSRRSVYSSKDWRISSRSSRERPLTAHARDMRPLSRIGGQDDRLLPTGVRRAQGNRCNIGAVGDRPTVERPRLVPGVLLLVAETDPKRLSARDDGGRLVTRWGPGLSGSSRAVEGAARPQVFRPAAVVGARFPIRARRGARRRGREGGALRARGSDPRSRFYPRFHIQLMGLPRDGLLLEGAALQVGDRGTRWRRLRARGARRRRSPSAEAA